MIFKVLLVLPAGMLKKYSKKRSWAVSWSVSVIRPLDTYCPIGQCGNSLKRERTFKLITFDLKHWYIELSLNCLNHSSDLSLLTKQIFILMKSTFHFLHVYVQIALAVVQTFCFCRGRDRCRHFVINQSETGQFAVSGDANRYDSVSDLIKYYKTRPIEPFGEYLTSSCFEVREVFSLSVFKSLMLLECGFLTAVLLYRH